MRGFQIFPGAFLNLGGGEKTLYQKANSCPIFPDRVFFFFPKGRLGFFFFFLILKKKKGRGLFKGILNLFSRGRKGGAPHNIFGGLIFFFLEFLKNPKKTLGELNFRGGSQVFLKTQLGEIKNKGGGGAMLLFKIFSGFFFWPCKKNPAPPQ